MELLDDKSRCTKVKGGNEYVSFDVKRNVFASGVETFRCG